MVAEVNMSQLETVTPLLIFDLRDMQQSTETLQQRIHFEHHLIHHGALSWRIAQVLLHPVKRGAQPGQRREQIMRDMFTNALGTSDISLST